MYQTVPCNVWRIEPAYQPGRITTGYVRQRGVHRDAGFFDEPGERYQGAEDYCFFNHAKTPASGHRDSFRQTSSGGRERC